MGIVLLTSLATNCSCTARGRLLRSDAVDGPDRPPVIPLAGGPCQDRGVFYIQNVYVGRRYGADQPGSVKHHSRGRVAGKAVSGLGRAWNGGTGELAPWDGVG